MLNFNKIKQNLATYISIYKIFKFIKKSNKNAYNIGNEIASIHYLLYKRYKYTINNNQSLNIYTFLLEQPNYNKYIIGNFLNKNIDFSKFFSIFKNKILKLKDKYLWDYLRGYYINNLDIFNTNLNVGKTQFWFILYDFHLHYFSFIFSTMYINYKNIGDIDFLLNNCYDNYSINDTTDNLNYKMLFVHEHNKFNDSIKNILDMFYLNVKSESQLFNEEDIIMYRKYISYINN